MGQKQLAALLLLAISIISYLGSIANMVAHAGTNSIQSRSKSVYYTAEKVYAEGGSTPQVYFVPPSEGASLFLTPPAGPVLSGIEAYFNMLQVFYRWLASSAPRAVDSFERVLSFTGFSRVASVLAPFDVFSDARDEVAVAYVKRVERVVAAVSSYSNSAVWLVSIDPEGNIVQRQLELSYRPDGLAICPLGDKVAVVVGVDRGSEVSIFYMDPVGLDILDSARVSLGSIYDVDAISCSKGLAVVVGSVGAAVIDLSSASLLLDEALFDEAWGIIWAHAGAGFVPVIVTVDGKVYLINVTEGSLHPLIEYEEFIEPNLGFVLNDSWVARHGMAVMPGSYNESKALLFIDIKEPKNYYIATFATSKGRLLHAVAIGDYVIATGLDGFLVLVDVPATLSQAREGWHIVDAAVVLQLNLTRPVAVAADNENALAILYDNRLDVWLRTLSGSSRQSCPAAATATVTVTAPASTVTVTRTVTRLHTVTTIIVSAAGAPTRTDIYAAAALLAVAALAAGLLAGRKR